MPPKGRRGSLADLRVEEDGAALQLGGEASLLGAVTRPYRGCEAEGGVVGEGDGFIDVGYAKEHCDGAEYLFAIDLRAAGNAGQHGGLVVDTPAQHGLSAGEQAARRPGARP